METKLCGRCGKDLPVDMFWIQDKKYGYRRKNCKECDKARMRERYAARDDVKAYSKRKSMEWAKANPEKRKVHVRRISLKRMYGMSEADYEAMVSRQGNKCALCNSSDPGRTDKDKKWSAGYWNIDHCHSTGKVRGLLCHTCNVRVGAYERLRDVVGFEKLIKYLTLE